MGHALSLPSAWMYNETTETYRRGDFALSVNDNGRGCLYYLLMLRSKEHPELDCSIELHSLDDVEPRCKECCRNAKNRFGIELNY